MATVYLHKKRKKRLEQGHPWIFSGEIERIEGEPAPGDIVSIHSHSGQYLASGYYNPASRITVRVVSYKPLEQMDTTFFTERIRQCMEHRRRFLPGTDSYRLIYGEADFLPGLIVDKFADVLVVQFLTLGMDIRKKSVVDALVQVVGPSGIYERSDVPVRELEELEQSKGVLYGECPRHVRILENGLLL